MNKVKQRADNPAHARFLYASKQMFFELKIIKFFLYFLNIIPVVLVFLPQTDETIKIVCSLISFALTLTSEVSSQMVSDYKEKSIIVQQVYEAEITGSTFSKIEYDRESTNDVHERAIRKGMPKLEKGKKKYFPPYVPDDISDDYSYLYIARVNAAKIRFLLSREFYLYIIILALIATGFVTFISIAPDIHFGFYYIICLWPMIVPLIRNAVACVKCQKQCVKICADIDNFFADGDDSVERLARFYFYVQNIEFEMMLVKPIIFIFLEKLYARPLQILTNGISQRFKDAIIELKSKKYISQPKGKSLITKVEYDYEKLREKEKLAKLKRREENNKTFTNKVSYTAPRREPFKNNEVVMSKSNEVIETKKTKTSTKVTPKKVVKPVKKEKVTTKKEVKAKTSNKTSKPSAKVSKTKKK
jgi:hypothetical protein